MLISEAILSRIAAFGVGFLVNSTSRVFNWSCVALWRFWFFCCWVSVLFRVVRLIFDWPGVGVDVEGDECESDGDESCFSIPAKSATSRFSVFTSSLTEVSSILG